MAYDKLERIMSLLEEISEIYPDMEKVIINDSEAPDYIIMTTNSFLQEMSDAFGISEDFENVVIEDEYPDMPRKKKKIKLQ
jgi:hypothetical protein